MYISESIKTYLDKSVLCWLATSSKDNIPNVSPKEVFLHYKNDIIIVANIASPQTVKNIKDNQNVCISFVDVLVQKGYQLKGNATIITKTDAEFMALSSKLLKITEGKFPFSSITKIDVTSAKPIIAPKYVLYPDTTEADQIESARASYGL